MILCVSVSSLGVAQNLELISSAGKEAQNSQTQMSYSIGELIVATGATSDGSVTQGYQQSNLTVTGIKSNTNKELIKIYPNPTADIVTLESSQLSEVTSLQLLDEKGTLVWSNGKISSDRIQISLESYAAGIYFLKVNSNSPDLSNQFRIIKSH